MIRRRSGICSQWVGIRRDPASGRRGCPRHRSEPGHGQGIALELGEQGATVWLSARNGDALEATASQIDEMGGAAAALLERQRHFAERNAL
jgi:hypothetical protein